MNSSSTAPTYHGKRFECPRCRAFAGQSWHDLFSRYRQGFEPLKDGVAVGTMKEIAALKRGAPWVASQCASCEQVALWRDQVLVFPAEGMETAVPDPSPEMPQEAEELYREAAATLPVSRRAAAALCRAALEQLAVILTPDAPPKARLDDRLATLSHEVSQPVWEVLQAVRHLGNTALHGSSSDDEAIQLYLSDTDPQIPLMFFEAMNMLVDERIVRPARASALFDKLPRGVQEAIHRKRQP
jgi:hypothetical protein